jgi:Protein of unknown function (DUF2656)
MVHDTSQGRMLLSHNFDVSPDLFTVLSREEFTAVFAEGLSAQKTLQCRMVENPHWIVEVLFATDEFSPEHLGKLCAQALAKKRRIQQDTVPEILALGGLKTTPPTSDSPDALQPGNWGVDVVETQSAKAFLQSIGWENTIAQRPPDSVFKVEVPAHR